MIPPKTAIHQIVLNSGLFAVPLNSDTVLLCKVAQIAEILRESPEVLKDGDVMTRLMDFTKSIAKGFQESPELLKDDRVMMRVMDVTKSLDRSDISSLRATWIEGACARQERGIVRLDLKPFLPEREKLELVRNCPKELGQFDVLSKTLTFSKEALEKINENDFWDFIQNERVKTLVIRQTDGQLTEYGNFILGLLIEKRPAPSLFLEMAKVEIEEKLIEIPKARLFLCGKYFEPMLIGCFKRQTIVVPITLNAFNAILALIDGKEKDPATIEEDYETAIDFLDFSLPLVKIPDGCLGLELFEKMGGKLTEFKLQQWKEWIQAIEEMKKDIPEGVIFGIDPGLSINDMAKIIQDPSNGNVTNFRYYDPSVEWRLGQTSASPCLFVRARGVLGGTINKSYDVQLKLLGESGHLYEPLSTREAVASECLHFLKSGERLLRDRPSTFTRTSDQMGLLGMKQMIVVGFSTTGLNINRYFRDFLSNVGITPYRKFYRH